MAKAIARLRGNNEVFILLSDAFEESVCDIRNEFHGILPEDNIFVFYVPKYISYITGNVNRRKAAEVLRETFISNMKPDVVHVFSFFESFKDDAVTGACLPSRDYLLSASLYDLIPMIDPARELKNDSVKAWYEEKLDHFKKADVFLAISESSRKEGIDYGKLGEDRIVNVSSAVSEDFCRKDIPAAFALEIKNKFGIDRPFLLYAGGTDRRKNVKNLISAYAGLPKNIKRDFQLVIVCGNSVKAFEELTEFAKEWKIDKNDISFTGYISDEELIALYNMCYLFVFPSLHEGFGLPVLEAMSCNAAVIASRSTSIPEIVNFEEALFEPSDIDSIKNKIIRSLTDTDFYESLKANSALQASKFSWDVSAAKALEVFENFYEKRRAAPSATVTWEEAADIIADKLIPGRDILPALEVARCMADNSFAFKDRKTLFVDISELAKRDAKTGVQRVTRSLLKQFLANPPEGYEVRPVYTTLDSYGYFHADNFINRFLGKVIPEADERRIEPSPHDIFLGLDLSVGFVNRQMDYLDYMHRKGVKLYFIVHDILPITMPDKFHEGLEKVFTEWLVNISKFDGIVCVSATVAKEVKNWQDTNKVFRKSSHKVTNFHNSGDIEDSVPTMGIPKEAAHIFEKANSSLAILSVSTVEPRKGYDESLAAMEKLWAKGYDFIYIIVGKKGWKVDGLCKKIENHKEFGKRLFWLSGISDEYLNKLYALSDVLLIASLGEGFGLSIVEAAGKGKPIIARDIPVFREIACEHAFYFQNDLSGSIEQWIGLYKKDAHPKSEGMKLVSWRESADIILRNIIS